MRRNAAAEDATTEPRTFQHVHGAEHGGRMVEFRYGSARRHWQVKCGQVGDQQRRASSLRPIGEQRRGVGKRQRPLDGYVCNSLRSQESSIAFTITQVRT